MTYADLLKKVADLGMERDLATLRSMTLTKISGSNVEVHFQSAFMLATEQMRNNFDPQYVKVHDRNPIVFYDAAYLIDESSGIWKALGISASVPVIK